MQVAQVMVIAGNTLNVELNPICKSQLAELFCGNI